MKVGKGQNYVFFLKIDFDFITMKELEPAFVVHFVFNTFEIYQHNL